MVVGAGFGTAHRRRVRPGRQLCANGPPTKREQRSRRFVSPVVYILGAPGNIFSPNNRAFGGPPPYRTARFVLVVAVLCFSFTIRNMAKSASPQLIVPNRVDFPTWKQSVERQLAEPENKNARVAFGKWLKESPQRVRTMRSDTRWEDAYKQTRPPVRSSLEQQWHERAVEQIMALEPYVNNTVFALERSGSKIVSKDGRRRYELSVLLSQLKNASSEIKSALAILRKSHEREAEAFAYCWEFFVELRSYDVGQTDAADLCRVLMTAHGFSDAELDIFSPDSIESGKLRHRVAAFRR